MKIAGRFYYIQKSNVEINKVGPLQTTAGILMGKAKFLTFFHRAV
jgi:hypothetical protein